MQAIRGKDTMAEVLLRKALYARGVRYRKNYSRALGTPDIAVVWAKLAVFVDGDFWHGNSWRLRGLPDLASQFPSRKEFWVRKISRNMERDREVTRRLSQEGWTVMRFWESEVLANVERCVETVVSRLSESA